MGGVIKKKLDAREDNSGRQRRSWNAYELTMLPSRNRTLDSNVVGMNVGLCVNDSRIDVMVDYGNQTEAPVRTRPRRVGIRLFLENGDCGWSWSVLAELGIWEYVNTVYEAFHVATVAKM